MSGGFKDVTLMLKASSQIGVSLDVGQIIAKKMEVAIAAGMGEQDWSSIYEITRKNSVLASDFRETSYARRASLHGEIQTS